MGCFLSGIGVVAIVAGLLIFRSVEIEGLLLLGFGFVIIGIGGIVTAINDVYSV